MAEEKHYTSTMSKRGHADAGLTERTLRSLTFKKVIIVILAIVLLKAAWTMVSHSIFEPEPLELSSSEMNSKEMDMQNFKPQSCVMENGVCKPYSEASVPQLPAKGLYAYGDTFYLDARPFKIFSGSFHYFRTHPAQWGDRLLRMKASGLNTVTTYVPWNMHEKKKGEFNFDGICDLPNFIEQVKKVGLKLIVRPGPYICAEWEYGGLPSWLLHDPTMIVRSSTYPPYLKHVEEYFSKLFPLLSKYTYKRGGPIIAFQVENEFGSFGNDLEYLKFIVKQFETWQLDELLFTSDGDKQLPNGTIPGILATVNFVREPEEKFAALQKFQPKKPLMVTEFWAGWFDHWGESHHTFDPAVMATTLETILSYNASINFYMYVGGTNFGFWNGANYLPDNDKGGSHLGATITSYDYDAPLSESGDVTSKFTVIRQLLMKHSLHPLDLPDIPPNPAKRSYGKVTMTEYMDMNAMLQLLPNKAIELQDPVYMESLPINSDGGQGYGWILYRTQFKPTNFLTIEGQLKDRAQMFINGHEATVLSYWDYYRDLFNITLSRYSLQSVSTLDLLVENMGRINYERVSYNKPLLSTQRKGFQGRVRTAEGHTLTQWEHFPLEFCDKFLSNLETSSKWQPLSSETYKGLNLPIVYRGSFTITSESQEDTFLDMMNWGKGTVFINGFHLGRYWSIGPQTSLYVPGPILMQGKNEVIIFETDKVAADYSVGLTDHPALNNPPPPKNGKKG